MFTRALVLRRCAQAAASPSYVQHYIHELASGVMDYKMAINLLSSDQQSMQQWFDDIQSRIEQIGCEQSNVRAQVNATISARNKANQLLTMPASGAIHVFGQDEALAASIGRVLHGGNAQAGGKDVVAERTRMDTAVLNPQAPSSSTTPTDRDCSKIRPDPSYVAEVRHWSCSTAEACNVYDEFTMNLVADMRRDTQVAADDLQIRIGRLICQQRNINSQLAYLAQKTP